MKKKTIPLIIYSISLIVDFYLLPLLIMDTGTGMLFMLCVARCARLHIFY